MAELLKKRRLGTVKAIEELDVLIVEVSMLFLMSAGIGFGLGRGSMLQYLSLFMSSNMIVVLQS